MIFKASVRGNAPQLAVYLLRRGANEAVQVKELRGAVAEDLPGAFQEFEAIAAGTRCQRHLYHLAIATRADERLTPAQEARTLQRLEEELGFTDQPRAVVAHVKDGRAHLHVVWSRIDLATMTAISDSHNYRTHERVARELEQEFGHARVQGAHYERDGAPRPPRTPTAAEQAQAARSGLSPADATAQITALWARTDSGPAFAAALTEAGWQLARGDHRDFVVVDPHGETHSLARRVAGARAKDVRARLADLDPASLPSAAEARAAVSAHDPNRDPAVTAHVAWEDQLAAAAIAQEQARAAAAADNQALAHYAILLDREDRQLHARQAREARAFAAREAALARAEAARAAAARHKPEPTPKGVRAPVPVAARLVESAANVLGEVVDLLIGSAAPAPPPPSAAQLDAAAAELTQHAEAEAEADKDRQARNAAAAAGLDPQEARLQRLLDQIHYDVGHERRRDRTR